MSERLKRNQKGKRNSLSMKFISVIVSISFILSTFMSFTTFAEGGPLLTINKSVDKPNPFVGENFVYTIKYANPSTTENAFDVVITDVLPANIEYVSHLVSDDLLSVNVTNDGTHDIVQFVFLPVFNAGHTGLVKIIAKFIEGKTTALSGGLPNTAINTATIKPSNGNLVTSNPVTVTPKLLSTPDWLITKTRFIPLSVLPVVGQNVSYEITVNSNSKLGGLDLKNIVVEDTLPIGSTFVSASDGGLFSSGKTTWNIAYLPVGTSKKLYIVIKYQSPDFTILSSVTNSVTANAFQFDNSTAPTKTASATHGFTTPFYNAGAFSKNGRQSNDRYSVGQTAKFYLSTISNLGNVPFDRIEVEDTIPTEIKLTQFTLGSYTSAVNVEILYKTNLNNADWLVWEGSPTISPANEVLQVSDLNLPDGDFVTRIKWIITDTINGQIQPGFANISALQVFGTVFAPLSGNIITNNATLKAYSANTAVVNKSASKVITVIDSMPWLVPQKTIKNNQTNFNYKDTVEFTLRIKNHDFATGDYVNPIAVDTIPPEYENIIYLGWEQGNSSITTPPEIDLSGTKSVGGTTYTLFKAIIDGTLQPGEYIDIKYSAKIKDKTNAGYIRNNLYISTLNNNTLYENDISEIINDENDLDGDFIMSDRFIKSEAKVFVNFMGSLDSSLSIKGQTDADFGIHQYPDYTSTQPGGLVDYQLKVKNSGSNGPISNLVIINKLPNLNDTGVIDETPRETAWTPFLVNNITGVNGSDLPTGATIYYSTVANPSCVELTNPANYVANPADLWSTTPPLDITTVKSIKISFGSRIFNTNDEVIVEWPMRAPVGALTNLIAWDSFGYGATYPDSDSGAASVVQSPFLPSEPLKVGFKIENAIPLSAGNFVWEDSNKNGVQDSGEKGINGVLVNLYEKVGNDYNFVAYSRTGNDHNGNPGYYLFPDRSIGTYRIEFIYPKSLTDSNNYTSNYYLSPFTSGSNISLDSNGDPSTLNDYNDNGIIKNSVISPDFTLDTVDDPSIDLGLYRLGQIGDKVFYDRNLSGLYDSGEAGIAGVTVSLLDSLGNPAKYRDETLVPNATTDSSGNYLFTNLDPDTYQVRFDIPNGYKLSTSNVGVNDAIDSDPVKDAGSTATTIPAELSSGQVNLTVDMGVYLAHIGNMVWNDLNADGIKNGLDAGINAVIVNLFKDGSPVVFKTTTTNSSGIYSFDDLFPGTYVVQVIKPAAYNKFSPSAGTTQIVDNDNDANQTTGMTSDITIVEGQRIDTIDIGMYKFGSIGDKVWNDYDGDGVQDAGEPGIAGITVQLSDKNGNSVINGLGVAVSDASTGPTGLYSFTNLEPGEYQVVFTNPAQKYKLSPSKIGSNNTDSDGLWIGSNDPTTRASGIIVNSGSTVNTVDQGMFLGAIGDFIWNDLNANGVQDVGEPGIVGATVSLLDGATLLPAKDVNGNTIPSTLSIAGGLYRFENLGLGTYVVQFSLPTGYNLPSPGHSASTTVFKDSNADITTLRSDLITLSVIAQRDLSVDAGFFKYATIGDFVWEDKNANGIQDSGEPGIQGATVTLLNSVGGVITTSTTNSSGFYSFINLIPGTYAISSALPSGFDGASTPLQGGNASKDSNINVSTFTSLNVTVISGQYDATLDAGFYKFAAIGNFVWVDINGNGTQDLGEPPVAGVTVNLHNGLTQATLLTTTTDSNGFYNFTGLVPGSYTVSIVKPASFTGVTLKDQGSDNAIDSDFNSDTAKSDTVILTSGENNTSLDVGLYVGASIGDFIWLDKNANGLQESGEAGISGVTVNLLNSIGTLVATTTTDMNGAYQFTALPPSTYTIAVVKPSGYIFSVKAQGTDNSKDSDIIAATSKSDPVTVISGESNQTIDAGLYKYASVGDFVWSDLNANGIQDSGEQGIIGVTVNLLNSIGIEISTTITNASGFYAFESLIPNTYQIEIEMPSSFTKLSPKLQLFDTAKDSDIDPIAKKSTQFTLQSGDYNHTLDAGLYNNCSIGNFIWNDLNANGIQDAGEIGIPLVKVNLLDASGVQLSSTTTDAYGQYLFSSLLPGSYQIQMIMPAGYDHVTGSFKGTDSTHDSDIDVSTLLSPITTLVSGENNDKIDGGFYKDASISDFIWEDLNADGIQNIDEIGIPFATVNLMNESGEQIATTTTDASGYYSFAGLIPGIYSINATKPNGFDKLSDKKQGNDSTKDSDLNDITFTCDPVILQSGENNESIDSGFYKLASLGNFIWEDLNANGLQEAGEPGISGVMVILLDSAGVQLSQTSTNINGEYSFTEVIPGAYFVKVVIPEEYILTAKMAGSNISTDSDINIETSQTDSITIVSGENNSTIDCGLYKLASIGDLAWYDINANGVQESGESGLPGVTVSLFNSLGTKIDTTATDSLGKYSFENLIPGIYSIQMELPENYSLSEKSNGLDKNVDSDLNIGTLKSDEIVLTSGQFNSTIDAGFYKVASVGDFIWEDFNANGIQDTGEVGIPSVIINLLNASGEQIASTTTDSTGYYSFNGLIPGAYSISVTKPAGFDNLSDKQQGSEPMLDSDLNSVTLQSDIFTLLSDEINVTIDGGFYKLASIGDFIWEDEDADGIQDQGENGIPSVTIILFNEEDEQIASTTTDASGYYSFGGLIPGTYSINVIKPEGFDNLTSKQQSNDNAKDSDLNTVTLTCDPVILQSGENNTTVDAGFYKLASIGNFIWEDLNANGLQDVGEPGIPGVVVHLFDNEDVEVSNTSTTDENGYYLFENLIPGSYKARIGKPSNMDTLTLKSSGNDSSIDSDFDPSTFESGFTTLQSGEINLSIDAGFYKSAIIGNFVWYDDNSNGLQDEAPNRGVNGVIVSLYDSNNEILTTMITQNDEFGNPGFYQFTGLIPGSYSIGFSNLPAGFEISTKNVGQDMNLDSDADGSTFKTVPILVQSSQIDNAWDMGIAFASNPLKTIGSGSDDQSVATLTTNGDRENFIFYIGFDVPENCIKVNVTDDLEDVLAVTDVENDISIIFNNADVTSMFTILYNATTGEIIISADNPSLLEAGRYQIIIHCGIKANSDLSGYTDDTIPNIAEIEINNTTEFTNSVSIKPIYMSLGKYVWIDDNKDGIQNEGVDHGVNGVTVQLFTKDGVLVATLVTANNEAGEPGYYLFTKLNPGDYYVKFLNLPKDYRITKMEVGSHDLDSDVDPETMITEVFSIKQGDNQLIWDMGIYYENPEIAGTSDRDMTVFYLLMFMTLTIFAGIFITRKDNKSEITK